MKRIFILFFGFFILVGAGGASDEEHMDSRDIQRGFDLFYLFSSHDADHQKLALRLGELAQEPDYSFRLITVARDASGRAAQQPQVDRGSTTRTPAAISQRYGDEADYIVLVDLDGRVRAEGDGGNVERVLALAMPSLPLSTDVKEDTWGKIKDLFQ